jgi:cytoplasmic iron level regulating protein YaaA (DUF328/UPF0246 family)
MLFLLPPSETKAVGGGSLTVSEVALTFGGLNEARERVHSALVKLCKRPRVAATVLKLSPKQLSDIELNLGLQSGPTMRAMERYTGTLYDAIHGGVTGTAEPLTEAAWARAKQSVLIQSSLFGLIPATDLIPGYRLGSSVSLPGAPLKKIWPPAHESIFRRLNQGLIIDLRSKAYVDLAPIPADVPSVWVEVVSRESDGKLRALNHFNKRAKGLLIRAILNAEKVPNDIEELAGIASAAGMELYESGGQLILVTDQIKKAQR